MLQKRQLCFVGWTHVSTGLQHKPSADTELIRSFFLTQLDVIRRSLCEDSCFTSGRHPVFIGYTLGPILPGSYGPRGERSARRWVHRSCDLGLLAVCPPLGNNENEPVSLFTRLLASLSATVSCVFTHKLSVYRPACVAFPSAARGQRRQLSLRVAFLFLLRVPAKSDFSSLWGPVARRKTNHSGP